jgi:RNA polymerase sigma-70 factor (ECF subfamily)
MTVVAKPEGYLEPSAERRLAELCIGGDEKAWGALHRQFAPIAVAFLRRMGVVESDLEDAAQEVFLQVFRYLPRFREESELRTWLYQLCITQARRTRNARRIRDILDKTLSRVPVATLVSSPAFSEAAAQRQIDAALMRLSEVERTVFVLYEMEGLAGKEIATIVGAKEATVWRRLHYARRTFRAALGFGTEESK